MQGVLARFFYFPGSLPCRAPGLSLAEQPDTVQLNAFFEFVSNIIHGFLRDFFQAKDARKECISEITASSLLDYVA